MAMFYLHYFLACRSAPAWSKAISHPERGGRKSANEAHGRQNDFTLCRESSIKGTRAEPKTISYHTELILPVL